MGGVEMREADEALSDRLQILMHEREQTEASDKNEYALQRFKECNRMEPTREMRREDDFRQGTFFHSSFAQNFHALCQGGREKQLRD